MHYTSEMNFDYLEEDININIFVLVMTYKMKWSELKKKAIQKGWYLARNGKEHDIYAHPDRKDILVIERHESTEVRKGLYFKLKKQIGF